MNKLSFEAWSTQIIDQIPHFDSKQRKGVLEARWLYIDYMDGKSVEFVVAKINTNRKQCAVQNTFARRLGSHRRTSKPKSWTINA